VYCRTEFKQQRESNFRGIRSERIAAEQLVLPALIDVALGSSCHDIVA
jgi:hypothetical protein